VKPADRDEHGKGRLPGFEDAGEDGPPLLGTIGDRRAFGRAHKVRHCLSACNSSDSEFTVGKMAVGSKGSSESLPLPLFNPPFEAHGASLSLVDLELLRHCTQPFT